MIKKRLKTTMIKTIKIYCLFFALFWTNISTAQNIVKAKIQPVAKSGLYKMVVPAEIRSYSQSYMRDFRILDGKNTEVPYFLVADAPEKVSQQFEDFPIISKQTIDEKSTTIEIRNPKAQINGLRLVIANSEVTKKYKITGSNDQKEWFGLINNGVLSDLKSAETTTVVKEVTFPLCSYRFLQIVFDDSTTLPINVLKIGNVLTSFLKGDLQEVKPKSIQTNQVTGEKKTIIKVEFDFPQFIDKVVFDMEKTHLFKRNVRIYTDNERIEKYKTIKYQKDIAGFSLVSNQDNTFEIVQTKQQFLTIEIDNQDNPPLQISHIRFFQKPLFAIADLKSTENYTVTAGNPNLMPPQYDLAYFKESISGSLPEAQISSIKYPKPENIADTPSSFWQQPWFMWLCIGAGGLMILFFSVRLIKDI